MEREPIREMKELSEQLLQASRAYYQEDREIMSNREYDALYDRLLELERETGVVLAGSPSLQVGYEAVDALPKESHEQPMLSLDKTKEREQLRAFIGDHKTLLSWKMDGLTVVLSYDQGRLVKAVTRGNGIIGEVVTNNARVFCNLPVQIRYTGKLVLRGEAVITYSDFERINASIEDADARYKNPRNLCSGSVRQLNNEVTASRNVRFFAFSLVSAEGVDFRNSREEQYLWLERQGFQVVEYRAVTADTLDDAMDHFAAAVQVNDFPSDGLVALYDDIAYGDSLGTTSKFPRNAYAFKWSDAVMETTLLEIEWSPSRTGLINPVAIFEPVELEGTTVSRASVHNVSIVKELKLGVGDTISVYKANMIIPQIAENLTGSGNLEIPFHCPACGGDTVIRRENDVEFLYCTNPECPAKRIKAFTLFASRDALNIDGLSEATLEKFIARGFVERFGDLFRIAQHREEIIAMEGFGERSYEKLAASLERSRRTALFRMIYGLGIPGIGLANAKMLCRYFDDDLQKLRNADPETLSSIEGVGPVLAGSIYEYFHKEENLSQLEDLVSLLEFPREEMAGLLTLSGKTFVITGNVEHFANRSQLKEQIEALGGKVTGSVTKKTDYLINNDTASRSSKNKKAKELGIPILSEQELLQMMEETR